MTKELTQAFAETDKAIEAMRDDHRPQATMGALKAMLRVVHILEAEIAAKETPDADRRSDSGQGPTDAD
jgi:hypothetical protein